MAARLTSSRRAQRVRAFQVLYGLHFTDVPTPAALKAAFAATPRSDDEGDAPGEATPDAPAVDQSFSWELVEGVWSHNQELDTIISRFSRNWRVDRMGRIELTLLRLALFELAFRPDVPPKVVINEALELTARFGDAKAKSFINGILDAAAKAAVAGTLQSGEV